MTASPDYGIPATGSPLYAATISVDSHERTLAVYRDVLGLDVLARRTLRGPAFEAHWRLPSRGQAEAVVLTDRECPVGRLVLLQFDASNRQYIRQVEGQNLFGLINLNFYVDDIETRTGELDALGCTAWSRPLVHDMGPDIGQPIEVMLDGPDGVIINLIQLRAVSPQARILRTIAYLDDQGGFNRCGATAVATSAHNVREYDRARAFYADVLGMSVRNDIVLQGTTMEQFTRFPKGARLRDTYLQGNHIFGKIALIQPLNLAARQEAEIFSPVVDLDMLALGRVRTAIVRNPGSGALHELVELTN